MSGGGVNFAPFSNCQEIVSLARFGHCKHAGSFFFPILLHDASNLSFEQNSTTKVEMFESTLTDIKVFDMRVCNV